jgi:hypothetical protein
LLEVGKVTLVIQFGLMGIVALVPRDSDCGEAQNRPDRARYTDFHYGKWRGHITSP